MRRQRRLEDKLFEEERKQMQQEKLKKEIKKELEKRKVEHGVMGKAKKQFQKKSLIRDSSLERDEPLRKEAKVELYDFSLEEEKDMTAIKNFITKYKKLLHFLFKTYANTGYSHKQVSTFDQMQERLETMSLAEAIVMLKKNSIIPDLLHKDEARTLLRLVNSHILGDKREGKALTYDAFVSYFLQIAMFVFSRAPIDLSQKPPIESAISLLKLFEKSAVQRGESIKLFENPDHTILADNDVLKAINKLLKKNPNTPMPDGFKKIKIKEYRDVFKVPEYMPIPEKNKIALEIMDDILSKNFGFHIFEPISEPFYTYKAKPVLKQLMKYPMGKKDVPFVLKNTPTKGRSKNRARNNDPIPTHAYKGDHSVDRKNPKKKSSNSMAKGQRFNSNRSLPPKRRIASNTESEAPSQRKRVYNDVTPELGLNLRLEVVKYPMHQRDVVQEVAEVLEEVLQACEKGQTKLPPRKKYGLHSYMNQAQLAKVQKREEEHKRAERSKASFQNHKEALHNRLLKMKEEKRLAESERREQDKATRSKLKEKKKKQMEEAKARIQAREEKEKKKQEEHLKSLNAPSKPTQEEIKSKEKRMEFLSKRKNQMRKEFNSLSKQRQGTLTEDEMLEQEKKLKKNKEMKLKQFFEKNKELKAQNDAARKEYMKFYESSKVQDAFEHDFDTISESYLNFARQQKYVRNLKPGDFQMSFAQFKKFGHDMKIYPQVVTFEDFNYIFKMITKEKREKNKEEIENEESKFGDKDTLFISFNEFKDALTRVACLAKYKLGGLAGIADEDCKEKEAELK